MEIIPVGAKLLIETEESLEGQTGLVLNSIFQEMLPEDYILFSAPIHKGTVYPLSYGETVHVRYQTEEGVFSFTCIIISRPIQNFAYLIKAHLTSEIRRRQYRGFYRMKKAVKGQLEIERDDEVVVSDFMTHDISATGLYVYSNESLIIGDYVRVSLPAGEDGEPVSFYAEVMWIKESPRYDYTNCAGLNFIYGSEQDRETMAKYVFDLQLAVIQRRLYW